MKANKPETALYRAPTFSLLASHGGLRYASKRMRQFVKFVRHFLISHTFMICLWICAGSAGIQIAALFAKTRCNSANASHFHGKRRCSAVQPSKCSAHGGRKAAHMALCFQVPLRHICCILFDALLSPLPPFSFPSLAPSLSPSLPPSLPRSLPPPASLSFLLPLLSRAPPQLCLPQRDGGKERQSHERPPTCTGDK